MVDTLVQKVSLTCLELHKGHRCYGKWAPGCLLFGANSVVMGQEEEFLVYQFRAENVAGGPNCGDNFAAL